MANFCTYSETAAMNGRFNSKGHREGGKWPYQNDSFWCKKTKQKNNEQIIKISCK